MSLTAFIAFWCLHVLSSFSKGDISLFPDQDVCRIVIVNCVSQYPRINNFTIFDAMSNFRRPHLLQDICAANDDMGHCVSDSPLGDCYSFYLRSRYRFFAKVCHPGMDRILFNEQRLRCWEDPYYSEAVDCYRNYHFPEPSELPLFPTAPFHWEIDCFPSLDRRCRVYAAFHLYHWVTSRIRR